MQPATTRPAPMERVSDLMMAIWDRVRLAHPRLPADDGAYGAFASFVAARVPATELATRHVDDLYLAWACDRGDVTALAELERQILPVVDRALATFADRHEIVQQLRERMLTTVDDATPRGIAGYDGRAPLTVWLRVCATRIGLREQAKAHRNEPLDDRELDQLAPGVPDPELAYLKRVYGASFREAFDGAVASLAPRERNLLRLAVIDGLGIDQLAAIFHIHRATAARRLKQARETLVHATRDRMRVALSISESELESIMRMINSLADITLQGALATPRKSE